MTTRPDWYQCLGLPPNAGADEIRAAYHRLARRFHPDGNSSLGAAEEFKRCAEAYRVLGDAAQRAAYDAAGQPPDPLLRIAAHYSRSTLPAIDEPQVLYALLELSPGLHRDLPPPPINLCLVIDRSTSMQGERLDHVKAAVSHVVDRLSPADTFSIVTFSDRAEVLVPAQTGPAERGLAKARVSTLHAQGGTEILQGLLGGLIQLHRQLSPGSVNHLLLLTDGRTYGDEADCLLLARLAATDGILMSCLGIGEEWNDQLLDNLAGRTGGSVAYIHPLAHLSRFIESRLADLSTTYAERVTLEVALDPDVELEGAFRVAPEPGPLPLGRPVRLGSLSSRQPLRLLLKLRIAPRPPGSYDLARLRFSADVLGLDRRGETALHDLNLPVVTGAPPLDPPAVVLEALALLKQYQLQERAWQQAAAGDVAGAIERLRTVGTRLAAAGQPDLAGVALNAAAGLERTRGLPEQARRTLKYGTRALIAVPGPMTRIP